MRKVLGWAIEKAIFILVMTVITIVWVGAWVLYGVISVYYWVIMKK